MRKANKRHGTGKMARENAGTIAFLNYCGKNVYPIGLDTTTLDSEGYSEALAMRLMAARTAKRIEAEKAAEKASWWYPIYHNMKVETNPFPF